MDRVPPETIPAHIRPMNFAGIELILELLQCLRGFYTGVDMDSLLVLMCVSDATMRPFVLDPNTPPEIICAARPPDELRGSISRLLIAERTGLPRETVRRKVNELCSSGHLLIDGDDRVRVAQALYDPRAWAAIERGHGAVLRYLDRLEAFAIDPRAVARALPPD